MRSILGITVRTKWYSSPVFGNKAEINLKGNRYFGDR